MSCVSPLTAGSQPAAPKVPTGGASSAPTGSARQHTQNQREGGIGLATFAAQGAHKTERPGVQHAALAFVELRLTLRWLPTLSLTK